MNTYEVSWQFENETQEWCDSFLYYAENIEELAKLLRSVKNDKAEDDGVEMSVIFAQNLDDDDADADEREITDELPEDLLAE
jgi:hypothetical protein